MIIRWITGMLFFTVAILVIWWGALPWGLFLGFLLILAALEWRRLGNLTDHTLPISLFVSWLLIVVSFNQGFYLSFLPLILIFPAVSVLARQNPETSRNLIWTAAGMIWLSLPAAILYMTRLEFGWRILTLLLVATVAEDTLALYGGKFFGGERTFAPGISPNKTWAGSIGAVLGATVVIVVGGHYLEWPFHLSLSLGLLLGVFGQLGDLIISALKRNSGLDDTGRLFPGHGGILDRVDGLILNVCVFYPFCYWMVQST